MTRDKLVKISAKIRKAKAQARAFEEIALQHPRFRNQIIERAEEWKLEAAKFDAEHQRLLERQALGLVSTNVSGKPVNMTAKEFKRIREAVGLSINELADKLRLSSPRLLVRFEQGEQEVSGPVSILMELIRDGRF